MHRYFKIYNRPLSPHITVYTSQITSIYSIWHRFTGIFLIVILVTFLSILKLSSYIPLSPIFYFLSLNNWVQNALILNLIIIFFYHLLNGIRHITWDLGFNLSIKLIYRTAKYTIIILFLYLFLILQKSIFN